VIITLVEVTTRLFIWFCRNDRNWVNIM